MWKWQSHQLHFVVGERTVVRSKIDVYRRYEKLFVVAYAIIICLVLTLAQFPGSLALNLPALKKLILAAFIFNIVFYFLLPKRYLGKHKTVAGILFAIAFITLLLCFSGYDESPFFFLYYLTLLTAALYLGPRETLCYAIFITAIYLFMIAVAGRQSFPLSPLGVGNLINLMGLVMVSIVASTLAQMIKERERRIRSKAQKLSALNSLTRTWSSTLEDNRFFEHVVGSVSQLLNVPLCFLWIVSSERGDLIQAASQCSDPLPPDAIRVEIGQGLVGWAAQERETVILEDILKDPRLQLREVAQRLGIRSYLAIPLMLGERLLGVLEIGATSIRKFTKDEIDLCHFFADQTAIALDNSLLFSQGNERSRRLTELKKYRDNIQVAVEENEVTLAMTQVLHREFEQDQVVVMKRHPSENRMVVRNQLHPTPAGFEFSVLKEPGNCLALRSNRRFVMNDAAKDFTCAQNCHDNKTASHLCVPLVINDVVTGVVHMNTQKPNFWTPDRIAYAESFLDQTAPILSSLNLLQEAQRRAIIDSLTGLYNRRFLLEFLHQQIVQSKRNQQPLSVVMLDLDHFKQVNDTFGHEAGDMVLKLFSMRLKEYLRESDIAARYGGEEFVLVLPNTGLRGAMGVADEIRALTWCINMTQVLPDLPNISVSAGVASYPIHGETAEQLQRAADAALYQAKQGGRNRVAAANAA
jgi:diguanylate cyclase (GGDEF)-like protein